MTTKHTWILTILLVAGCTPPTQTEQEREARIKAREDEDKYQESAWRSVRLTANPDAVKGCKSLGNVSEASTNILGSGEENVQEGLKKKTAKMGGNVVFMMSLATNRYSQGSGEVYSCPAEPEATPTPTPAPKS